MSDDERAIRELVDRWLAASKAGDLATVLTLMADDAVFMVPGREPFGKAEFAAGFEQHRGVRIDASSDIRELRVLDDWAWLRNRLRVTMTPRDGGATATHAGWVLTILRREPDGRWVLARDANLLAPERG